MTIFKITPATSVLTTGTVADAFAGDSAGADTLIVDPSAFLVATGAGAYGALLANTGAWNVTVNGSIVSKQARGLVLNPGNAAVSTITVGANGEIGGLEGLCLFSAATIKNSGKIAGATDGVLISGAGTHTITNSGTITGTERRDP